VIHAGGDRRLDDPLSDPGVREVHIVDPQVRPGGQRRPRQKNGAVTLRDRIDPSERNVVVAGSGRLQRCPRIALAGALRKRVRLRILAREVIDDSVLCPSGRVASDGRVATRGVPVGIAGPIRSHGQDAIRTEAKRERSVQGSSGAVIVDEASSIGSVEVQPESLLRTVRGHSGRGSFTDATILHPASKRAASDVRVVVFGVRRSAADVPRLDKPSSVCARLERSVER